MVKTYKDDKFSDAQAVLAAVQSLLAEVACERRNGKFGLPK